MRLSDDYKPEYCEMLVEHMSKGYSFETFGAIVGNCKATLYTWVKKYPEFEKAKKIAFMKAQEFFESKLSAKLSGKKQVDGINPRDIDTTCLIFALKTRFHKTYGEKKEEDVADTERNVYVNIHEWKPENKKE